MSWLLGILVIGLLGLAVLLVELGVLGSGRLSWWLFLMGSLLLAAGYFFFF